MKMAMREKLVRHDVVECVLRLGPNLFCNAPMEACVVICRMNKPNDRRKNVLFINAVNAVTRKRAQKMLTGAHLPRIVTYQAFGDAEGFARVISNDKIRRKGRNLNIRLYVRTDNGNRNSNGEAEILSLKHAIANWEESSMALRESMNGLFNVLEDTRVTGGVE